MISFPNIKLLCIINLCGFVMCMCVSVRVCYIRVAYMHILHIVMTKGLVSHWVLVIALPSFLTHLSSTHSI